MTQQAQIIAYLVSVQNFLELHVVLDLKTEWLKFWLKLQMEVIAIYGQVNTRLLQEWMLD